MTTLKTTNRATLDDLLKVKEKAELINGRIVRFMPTGLLPTRIAGRVYRELAAFAEEYLQGEAFTDSLGYAIDELPSGRESISPDVSYFVGESPENLMRFIEGFPTFAVEVRSENDYTPSAEREMASQARSAPQPPVGIGGRITGCCSPSRCARKTSGGFRLGPRPAGRPAPGRRTPARHALRPPAAIAPPTRPGRPA